MVLGGLLSNNLHLVTPIGGLALPDVVGVSLEPHSSVVPHYFLQVMELSLALSCCHLEPVFRCCVCCSGVFQCLFGMVDGLFTGLCFFFFSGVFLCGLVLQRSQVCLLLYQELHGLQNFSKEESWVLLAPSRINLGAVVMTKGSGLRPQPAVCLNSTIY